MEQLAVPKTGKGSPEMFVGDVFVDGIAGPDAGVFAAFVHFTPGARNAWHTHAAGQTLHCTEGYGLVVTDDEVIALRPGVTVWTPPGQRHWHGAVPDQFMTHLAMLTNPSEASAASVWGEHVTDEEYAAAVAQIS